MTISTKMPWQMVPIDQVTEPAIDSGGPNGARSFTYIDISSIDNTAKRISEPKALLSQQAPSRAKQRLQPADVLVSMTRPNLNAVAIVPNELKGAIGSTGFCVLRAKSELNPKWLFYAVQSSSFIETMGRLVQGALYPAVRPRDVRAYKIPLPTPEEQNRLVEKIEGAFSLLDKGIHALTNVQEKLKKYRAAVLKAACEGDGDYRIAPFGEIVESMKNGIYKPRSAYSDDGFACLRMYNIEDGKILWKNIKRMELTKQEKEDYLLLPGDILINRVNSRELVGKAAVIPENLEPCVFESKNIRLRLNRALVIPRFIGYALMVYGPNHFDRNAQQVVGMASISQPQVAALAIPIPPLSKQMQIVGRVESQLGVIDELGALISANLQRATQLRQSILKKAFSGEVHV